MSRSIVASLAAASLLALATGAQAIPIAPGSQIDFTGGIAPIGSANVHDATGLDFLNAGLSGTPGGTIALDASPTGTFALFFNLAGCPAAASAGGCGTISDIASFTSFSALLPFYTITEGANSVRFNLESLTTVERSTSTIGGGSLTIGGFGTFLLSGYDPTPGQFILTAQGPGTTTFSATTLAAPVPEPASLALLGGGLLVVGLIRRRRS